MKRWSDDQKILTALERLGGNASAQELSDYIANTMKEKRIPARTIRYRLSTLMERGILLPSFLETDERKVGLGEGILLFQEIPERTRTLESVIREIPIFHWYVPTHGRYDGYLVHTAYDIVMPDRIEMLAKKMQKHGLINQYFFFDIASHHSKRIDFNLYNPTKGWSCNWDVWKEELMSLSEKDQKLPFEISSMKEVIEYDSKDILILRILKDSPDASMTSLAGITKLPLATVRDRIQRLRTRGVIRGYTRAYGFSGDLVWVSIFMRMRSKIGGILQRFQNLPFPGIILAEDPQSFCLRMGFTTSDLKQFMEGFNAIRPQMESYFFQFHLPDRVESKYREVFNLFDSELGKWAIPFDRFEELVERYGN